VWRENSIKMTEKYGNRTVIELGLGRFRASLRAVIRDSILKQYTEKRRDEGSCPESHFEFRGLKFKINYNTKYLVSFILHRFGE